MLTLCILVLTLSLTIDIWVPWVEHDETLHTIFNALIDALQRFYHEPEMDIVSRKNLNLT